MKKLKINRAINHLYLRDVGLLEFLFALTPMLSGFSLGSIPLSLLMWLFLLAIAILQGKIQHICLYKPLLLFVIYWFLHCIAIMMIDIVNLNGFIAQIIYFAAIFALYPIININKLKGSLNWVALIAIAGLLYQWSDITRGDVVHPLSIPGLTMPENRFFTESIRPSSFFMEPAAYVGFMICPLFFALLERKYIWSIILILSIFLTTSTTGLLLSFIMLGMSGISIKRVKTSPGIIVIIIGIGLYFALTRLSAFETGVDKLENTEVSTNVRLTQGLYVVSTMNPSEYIFGAPYYTAYNYCKSGRAPDAVFYGESVYMSTFWQMILLYGAIGLILYLNIYLQVLKSSKKTLTLITPLCIILFSSGYFIGGDYAFTLIIALVTAKKIRNSDNKRHIIVNI